MTRREILTKIVAQREFQAKNGVLSVAERRTLLRRLAKKIKEMESEICQALEKDLGKSATESYMTEIGLVLGEISYVRRHLRSWARTRQVYTPFSNFPARSFRLPSPYGVVLVISPWNYPFLLSVQPLVDAIAAGNSVILKPSEYSPATSALLEQLIAETFRTEAAIVVNGGVVECTILLDQDLDYIFYTGSTRVGEIVMKKAAKHFTPVTLEMGGKSPCIVDASTNLRLAARRIVFGKLLNAGQTCVAPDYIYCEEKIADRLIEELSREIIRQYGSFEGTGMEQGRKNGVTGRIGKSILENPNYPHIVNRSQFRAMRKLIEEDQVAFGGESDAKSLKIAPTIMRAELGDKCMKREIFGPILPVVTFREITEVVKNIRERTELKNPLALYIFSKSRRNQRLVLENCQFGGAAVNDTIMQIANNHLGFGGIKQSGIGAYHGKTGFKTFTHYKSVVRKARWLDLPMRYQPFGKVKTRLIRMFLR